MGDLDKRAEESAGVRDTQSVSRLLNGRYMLLWNLVGGSGNHASAQVHASAGDALSCS